MKRSKELLWKSVYKLSDEKKQKVNQLLQINTLLQKAYELKNRLDQWFKGSDETTFKRWKQENLQSFIYPFNNG